MKETSRLEISAENPKHTSMMGEREGKSKGHKTKSSPSILIASLVCASLKIDLDYSSTMSLA
jgi:hypothetical protein